MRREILYKVLAVKLRVNYRKEFATGRIEPAKNFSCEGGSGGRPVPLSESLIVVPAEAGTHLSVPPA